MRAFEEQSEALGRLQALVTAGGDRELVSAVAAARTATEDFTKWLQDETPTRTGPSGIGKAQYTWFTGDDRMVRELEAGAGPLPLR